MFKKAFALMKTAFAFVKSRLTKKAIAIILVSAVGVTGLGVGGYTLAKYAIDHNSDYPAVPAGFYFESNLLKLEAENASYHNGTNTITFDLMNFEDKLRKAELDIQYTVTITYEDGTAVSPAPVGTNTTGTMTADETPRTVTVSYENLPYGKRYVVTAQSTQPYTKTLKATFEIPSEDMALKWEVSSVKDDEKNEDNDLVTVTVKTNNYTGNVILNWQNGYVPDNTNPLLATATGASHTVTLESKSTYVFRFFKSQLSTVYDSTAFTVSLPGEPNN